MKLSDLPAKLANSGVPSDAYSLTGGLPNEAYCIERRSDGKWQTYYSERGLRSGLKLFDTEAEACDDLFHALTRRS